MRYRLRTLLILLALLPPLLWGGWLGLAQYREWLRQRQAERHYHQAKQAMPESTGLSFPEESIETGP